jgi:hypothetical protein
MGFELPTLMVIVTNCTGSCKSNYPTIMTIMAPLTDSDLFCLLEAKWYPRRATEMTKNLNKTFTNKM